MTVRVFEIHAAAIVAVVDLLRLGLAGIRPVRHVLFLDAGKGGVKILVTDEERVVLGRDRPGGLSEVQRHAIVSLHNEEMRKPGWCWQAENAGQERRVWAHDDATIQELPLDARGTVPWWPEERRHPTLHTLRVHTIAETARHAGHADIIRESIDGAAGLRKGVSNMPTETGAAEWKQHYDMLESIARSAHRASL